MPSATSANQYLLRKTKTDNFTPAPAFVRQRTDKLVPTEVGSRGPERKSWIPAGVYPEHDAGRE